MESNSKSNRNLIIAIVVVLILFCCCLVSALAGYYGYQAYIKAKQVVDQVESLNLPIDPNNPDNPIVIPNLDEITLPEGGLADKETRYSAWLSVQLVSAISGCQSPDASTTSIEVLQEPDANGVWVEEWKVKCSNGDYPYRVTFTPENGIVSVSVELPQ